MQVNTHMHAHRQVDTDISMCRGTHTHNTHTHILHAHTHVHAKPKGSHAGCKGMQSAPPTIVTDMISYSHSLPTLIGKRPGSCLIDFLHQLIGVIRVLTLA